jgi:hypothetical protein
MVDNVSSTLKVRETRITFCQGCLKHGVLRPRHELEEDIKPDVRLLELGSCEHGNERQRLNKRIFSTSCAAAFLSKKMLFHAVGV